MVSADATLNFNPDTSWVPEELSMLVGGVLGVCCLVIPVVLCIGLFRWLFCRMTGPVWDNAIGDRILVAVLVCAIGLGMLAQLAGFGMGVFGDGGAEVSVFASTEDGTGSMVDNSWKATAQSQLAQGDVGGAMGTIGDRVDWDSMPGGDLLHLGWDVVSGMVDTTHKVMSGDLAGAAGNVIDGLGWVGDKIGQGASWVGDKLGQGAGWVWDKISGAGSAISDWWSNLFG